MAYDGDIDVKALEDWKDNLIAYSHGVDSMQEEHKLVTSKYFEEFESMRIELQKRLSEAQDAYDRALDELYKQQSRLVRVEDSDGNVEWQEPDCSRQESVVEICRRKRDKCELDLKACDYYIANCSVDDYSHKLPPIEEHLHNAVVYLRDRYEKLVGYLSYGGDLTHSITSNDNYTVGMDGLDLPKEDFCFEILTDMGEPLGLSQIVIVDNQPLGFKQIRKTTDKDGRVRFSCKDTDDCSIYINGKEIYNGRLKKSERLDIGTSRVRRLIEDNNIDKNE